MLVASIIFLIALVLIALLFALRQWEINHGRTLSPALRSRADHAATELKHRALESGTEIQKLWPFAILLSRYLVHEAALGFAQIARVLEREAHNVAELVSHKRSFTPRETRSEFLRKMDRGNGTNIDRDTTGEIDQL